jgi:hypothetical protein
MQKLSSRQALLPGIRAIGIAVLSRAIMPPQGEGSQQCCLQYNQHGPLYPSHFECG